MARRIPALRLLALSILIMTALPAWSDWRPAVSGARLIGTAEFSWFGLRLYTARVWSAGAVQGWQQPFALELIYHRALSRDTLVQASLDEIKRLAERPLAPATVERWAQMMREAFVDVRPGMRITGLYLPGQGCRFYVDGQLIRLSPRRSSPSGSTRVPVTSNCASACSAWPQTRKESEHVQKPAVGLLPVTGQLRQR